jgi:formate hydrogenlyase subunit 4
VLQSVVVVVLAPLYAGAIGRAEASVTSRHGPSIFQPYFDLAKLLRKEIGRASGRARVWPEG